MKLYSNKNFKINNLDKYSKKTRKFSYLISNEGIFKSIDKKISKLIIKSDEVEYITEPNGRFMLDKSEISFIETSKIPFNYSELQYEEELFIVNDDINIVCVNDVTWYIEFANKAHMPLALNIMLNNV